MVRRLGALAPLGAFLLLATGCQSTRTAAAPATTSVDVRPPTRVQTRRELRVVWHRKLNEAAPLEYQARERSAPAWDGRRGWLFVADRFGVVRALDGVGNERWSYTSTGGIEAGLLLADDRLFVASTGGTVHALDIATGRERWRYQTGAELGVTPTLAGETLLVPTLADTLVALDAAKGTFRWIQRRPTPAGLTIRGAAGATVAGDRVFTAFSDGTVVALALSDGKVLWTRALPGAGAFPDVDTTPLVRNGRVFVASYGGAVHALDAADGSEVWTAGEALPSATQLVLAGGRVVVLAPGRAIALEPADGRLSWQVDLPGGTPSAAALAGEILLLGTEDGPLYGVSAPSGRPRVAFAPGNGISAAPVPTSDGLWVWSNGGWLYRLVWR